MKETKFNDNSIISPQSTKSTISDSNSNTSTKSSQSQTKNRSFITNSKLTSSRFNNFTNNHKTKMNQSRPEKINKTNKRSKLPFDNELVLQNLVCHI